MPIIEYDTYKQKLGALEPRLDTLAAAETEEDLSATRRVNINDLKFGPNYTSGI